MDHEPSRWKSTTARRGRLQFQLPSDATDDEIAYFKTLTPRVDERVA